MKLLRLGRKRPSTPLVVTTSFGIEINGEMKMYSAGTVIAADDPAVRSGLPLMPAPEFLAQQRAQIAEQQRRALLGENAPG